MKNVLFGHLRDFSCLAEKDQKKHSFKYRSTWSYENWFSKQFVISLNLPCLIACLVSCLLMLVFCCCSCFVVGDLCRSGCRQNFANFYLLVMMLSYRMMMFL